MTLIQSIILGIIQGLTEFLPVSSSGHLAIAKYFFGLQDVGMFFDVLLHFGTLIAVVVVYWRDIVKLVIAAVRILKKLAHNLDVKIKRKSASDEELEGLQYAKVLESGYEKFVIRLVIACIPVGLVGLFFDDFIESISKGILVPGICLLITGVILLLAETIPEGNRPIREMSHPKAFLVGVAQAFAAFPGISRSGSTIAATMLTGTKKESSVRFAFLLSVPVILGATLKSGIDVIKDGAEIGGNAGFYVIGALVAAIVGFGAIKLLILLVKKRKFRYFAFYCFAAGLFAIIGFFVTR